MKLRHTYRDRIVDIFDSIIDNQSDNIDRAARALADAIGRGGLVQVAGSGHSHILAEEVFYRAGGIAPAQALLDEDLMLHRGAERSTHLERETGRATHVLAEYEVSANDVLVIASNSGRNAYPVEMALCAREMGITTIAITSVRHAREVTSRHSSGKRLFEVADIVIDNGGEYGDGALSIEGLSAKLGPTSTIVGAYLMNTLIAEATQLLMAEGVHVDIYESANAQGRESGAQAMIEKWRGRIRGL